MQNAVLTWENVARDAANLAKRLLPRHIDKPFKGIIAVSRGGLFTALIVSHILNIRIVDVVCVETYSDNKELSTKGIVRVGNLPIQEGAGWLVVDDLADSGTTFSFIRYYFPKSCYSAIYAKPLGFNAVDVYEKEFAQDTWLVFPWETC